MKTILVPTDFSSASETALEFAARLAKNKHSRLVILHVFLPPVPVPQIPPSIWEAEKIRLQDSSMEKLHKTYRKIENLFNIPHEFMVESGEIVQTIVQVINKIEPELIVMGTSSSEGLASTIFGNTALGVMKRSDFPVFAVPANCSPRQVPRKFTFATDFQENDTRSIVELIELARSYKAQVNILHVSGRSIQPSEEVQLMNNFRQIISSATNYNQMSYEMLSGEDVEDELLRYIVQGRTDVMVFSTEHRDFFERLFHASVSKKIILKATIPILAFHYSKTRTYELF